MKRSVLHLGMARLGDTFGARLGWVGAVGAALVFATGSAGGTDMSSQAVRVLCWVGAGPAALAASRAPCERDRDDGVELLVACRGVSSQTWRRVRVAAAALACAARVAVPTLIVALTSIIVLGTSAVVVQALGAVVGGAIAGALIGIVAATCGEAGGTRGRSLFAAIVLLPWLLGDLWSVPGLSLVEAVDAGLSILTEATSRWS